MSKKIESFEAFIVLNEKNLIECHMVQDRLGQDALAIYPFEHCALNVNGKPYRGTKVVPCTITYEMPV